MSEVQDEFFEKILNEFVKIFGIISALAIGLIGYAFIVFMLFTISNYLFPVSAADKFQMVGFQKISDFEKIHEKVYFANEKENCTLKLRKAEDGSIFNLDLANDIEYVAKCSKDRMCFRTKNGEEYKMGFGAFSIINPDKMINFASSCTQKYYKGE